jgi:hypothetical protein
MQSLLAADRSRIIALIALPLTLVAPGTLHSQAADNKILAAMTTDSTAWQRVVVYTVGALSSQLVASATDPAAQAWLLEFPPNEPQEDLLRAQLRTILRMRQVMPADTIVRLLEFGPLVVSNDTARVDVRFEETRKCAGTGRTTGFGWRTTVLVPRDPRQKLWGAARSGAMEAGDRVGC